MKTEQTLQEHRASEPAATDRFHEQVRCFQKDHFSKRGNTSVHVGVDEL